MAEAVIDTAANSAASAETQERSYSDYMQTLTPQERQQMALTGNEPEGKPFKAEPAKEPAKPQVAAPAKAKIEPAAAVGDDDQDLEPEYYGTPEERAKQKHAFARKSRQLAELKAENKLLREQRTEKPAAAVAAPKAEVKTETADERPKRPRISDPKYANDTNGELYDKDLDDHDEKLEAWKDRKATRDRETSERGNSQRERSSQWSRDIETSKEAHDDFEAVAFSQKVFVSLPTIGVLMGMKGGTEVLYQIGKDPEMEKALLEETDIPGNYTTYEELAEAADKDPKLARELAAAEAIVRHEAKKILAGAVAKKKEPEPKPQPVLRTNAPAPGTRVNAQAAATGDPIADAYARGDYATGAKLEAARDVENSSRKRH